MRSLIRVRTLAALVLLIALSTSAWAGIPGRPIDRPGSPDPPPEVGDPDEPGNNLTTLVVFGRVFLVRVPLWGRPFLKQYSHPLLRVSGHAAPLHPRGRNAR